MNTRRKRPRNPELDLDLDLVTLAPDALIAGSVDVQLAAHGPEGDGTIAPAGADAQGLLFDEDLPAEEVRHEVRVLH